MNRPTLQSCLDQLTAFAAREQPEDWVSEVTPMRIGDATLTLLTVFWEGRESGAVPREARLTFGGDKRLLWIHVIDPGMFAHCCEEGFGLKEADAIATRKLASFDDTFAYLKCQPYHLADNP